MFCARGHVNTRADRVEWYVCRKAMVGKTDLRHKALSMPHVVARFSSVGVVSVWASFLLALSVAVSQRSLIRSRYPIDD